MCRTFGNWTRHPSGWKWIPKKARIVPKQHAMLLLLNMVLYNTTMDLLLQQCTPRIQAWPLPSRKFLLWSFYPTGGRVHLQRLLRLEGRLLLVQPRMSLLVLLNMITQSCKSHLPEPIYRSEGSPRRDYWDSVRSPCTRRPDNSLLSWVVYARQWIVCVHYRDEIHDFFLKKKSMYLLFVVPIDFGWAEVACAFGVAHSSSVFWFTAKWGIPYLP